MASLTYSVRLLVIFIIFIIMENEAKLMVMENETPGSGIPGPMKPEREVERPTVAEFRAPPRKMTDGAALLFADELKMTLERYLFGICPQTFKMQLNRSKNATVTCDLDTEQQDLAGRFATLALRAHSAARSDCARLGAVLVNTLGDVARTAQSRQVVSAAAAAAEANKKRKLSKSQKAKLQAKQKTALAVKKKAAAVAAAAAAKMAAATS